MKAYFAFVVKEFYHVLRDKKTLLILLGMPIVQILLFGFALTNEVKETPIAVLDLSKDVVSMQILEELEHSKYFVLYKSVSSFSEMSDLFQKGVIKGMVIFPSNLQENLLHQKTSTIQLIGDGTDINSSNMISLYFNQILNTYQTQVLSPTPPFGLNVQTQMLYNPQNEGAPNFVPGVMALVLLLICVMMTAVSIVREKESGTMEILLVSPLPPYVILMAKATPYLLLSLVNITTILMLSVTVFDLPFEGSLFLLYGQSILFILNCLCLGIFISTKAPSQQIAMFISLVGLMLPTIMFSGFMFPIENMPLALQLISNIFPSKWYYIIVKNIMLKGMPLGAIWKESLILLGSTLFLFIISIKNYKTKLE